MLMDVSRDAIRRPALLGYVVAVLAVGTATAGLALMQSRWQAAAHVSILLMAVIVTARVGGAKPGLLATALALLAFNYLLLHLPNSLADPAIYLARLLSLAVVSCYLVWITAAEQARAGSLRRALDEVRKNNEALRAENLERLRTEQELRTSEATFRALAQNAPGAIFICQEDRIRYANPTASAITGFSTSELCGRSFWENTAPESRQMIQDRGAARRRGEPLPPRFEVKILTRAGEERWLDFTETTFEFEGKPAELGVALDITERKQTEEAVRNSQELLNQVLATLPVGVVVTDRQGDIILGNAALKRIWGTPPVRRGTERWAQSKGWWHHSGKRIASVEWASVRALSKGQTSLNELIDIETYTGEHKTIQNSSAPIRNADSQIVGAVIVNEDVTERVRAEEALHDSADRLQHLSRRLLAVQEEERRHLSRELHDEFGQLLATITLHLQAAKSAAGPAAQPSLNESIALLQRAGTQVRSLALELRPVLLETAGLDATLRWLAEQHEQRTGILTEVVGHVAEVSGEIAIACFRVVQEALTNVVRHADARHVWIELSQTDGLLTLLIRDDGVGFDVPRTLEQAAGTGNLGLVGMRERVELLGGELAIESRPGKGSRIRVSFPLAECAIARPSQTA
jgi:PAS domain S-box-containing protein